MATNIVNGNNSRSITWTNDTGAAIASGAVVVMGATGDATLGIAAGDFAIAEEGEVLVQVAATVTKATTGVWKTGESLMWDASAAAFDDNAATPATGDVDDSAVAYTDGANGEVTAVVWFTGNPGAIA